MAGPSCFSSAADARRGPRLREVKNKSPCFTTLYLFRLLRSHVCYARHIKLFFLSLPPHGFCWYLCPASIEAAHALFLFIPLASVLAHSWSAYKPRFHITCHSGVVCKVPPSLASCVRVCVQAQVAFLQGERKGQENMKQDLVRRIKMLEYALKQER